VIADAIELPLDEFKLRRDVTGGVANQGPQLLRHDIARVEDAVELGPIAYRDRIGHANSGLVIGV